MPIKVMKAIKPKIWALNSRMVSEGFIEPNNVCGHGTLSLDEFFILQYQKSPKN
jgi:hypothetical protein